MFLAQSAAVCALPLFLPGCRRGSQQASQSAEQSQPINLDEVENAATFRPQLPATEPMVRVRVARVKPTGSSGESAGESASIRIGRTNQWLQLRRIGAMDQGMAIVGPVVISMTQQGWSIVDEKGFRPAVPPRAELEIAALADDSQAIAPLVVDLGGGGSSSSSNKPREYSGTLRLISRHDLETAAKSSSQGGAFDIVNHLPVESYLPGVLAGELYRHWHFETFAAQAIAARSFVCTEAAVFAGKRHYDVTNTASSQMYLGNIDHPRSIEAVQHTRGMVLAYDNLLVSGYYSSCCGGLAASATDAIGSNPVNDVAPLTGRSGADVCSDAPVFRWKAEHPLELFSKRVAAFGADRKIKELAAITRVAAVETAAVNPHGRPTRMRIIDEAGIPVEVTAENLRRAANFGSPSGKPAAPDRPLRSSHLQAAFDQSLVKFEGFGFGHGVGLCQYGAESLARERMNHQQIVRWYYPGVEVVHAYG